MTDEEILRRLLWINHNPDHFSALYGDDGEWNCGMCLIDFKRMPARDLTAALVASNINRAKMLLACWGL